jgi:chromosome segregation ATPase
MAYGPMPHDDLDHIPPIVPTRDGDHQGNTSSTEPGGVARNRLTRHSSQPAAMSALHFWARLIAIVALVAGVVACVWVWQLQGQLQLADGQMANYASRIADLEARLSDTDEGMNQNAAVQAVKVATLETEVRKLWDNVWKQSKQRLDKLETLTAAQSNSIKGLDVALASAELQLTEVSGDAAKLKSVADNLARVMSSASLTQTEVERVADSLNRIDLAVAKLDKRVAANQEAVSSIDAFRKQVNASLSQLRSTLRATQATP